MLPEAQYSGDSRIYSPQLMVTSVNFNPVPHLFGLLLFSAFTISEAPNSKPPLSGRLELVVPILYVLFSGHN